MTSYSYDGLGNLSSQGSGSGMTAATAKVDYSSSTKPGTANDANGIYGLPLDAIDPKNTAADASSPCGSTQPDCTMYSYDGYGDLTTVTPVNVSGGITQLGNVTFSSDGLGRTASVTNGLGVTATTTYDLLDRPLSTSYSGAGTLPATITFAYDTYGSAVSRVQGSASTGYQYDALERLTGENIAGTSVSCPTGPSNTMLCYSYDAGGNLTGLADGRGTDSYAYDAANRLVELTEASGRVDVFGYDADDHRIKEWLDATGQGPQGADGQIMPSPTGWAVQVVQSLNSAGRPCEITDTATAAGGATIDDTKYTYNTGTAACTSSTPDSTNTGQMLTADDLTVGHTTTYSYDNGASSATGRLTEAKTKNNSGGATVSDYSYGYDADGNITTDSRGAHTFNEANELSGGTISYDGDGSQLTGTGTGGAFTNTSNGIDQTTNTTTSTVNQTNTYAATDQVERMSAGATSFTAGRNGQIGQPSLQADTNASTGVIQYFVRDNAGGLIAIVSATTSSPAVTSADPADYYLTDATGNITHLTSPTGAITGTYTYDPYGNQLTSPLSADAQANPYRFASAYLDPTGLYKMGNRYYNPLYGRFTQQDSVAHTGDLKQGNRYAYTGDDPTNNLDPTGDDFFNFSISVCLGICLGLGVDISSSGLAPTESIGYGPDAGIDGSLTESAGDPSDGVAAGLSCTAGGVEAGVDTDGSDIGTDVGETTGTDVGCEADITATE